MTKIAREISIARPPAAVFAVLTDLERLPQWATIVVRTEEVSQQPIGDGCTFRQTIRVAGREIDTDWRVIRFESPHEIGYEATGPLGGRLSMTQRVRPEDGGSAVSLEVDYHLPGGLIGSVVDHAVEAQNERAAEESLENLKQLLDG